MSEKLLTVDEIEQQRGLLDDVLDNYDGSIHGLRTHPLCDQAELPAVMEKIVTERKAFRDYLCRDFPPRSPCQDCFQLYASLLAEARKRLEDKP